MGWLTWLARRDPVRYLRVHIVGGVEGGIIFPAWINDRLGSHGLCQCVQTSSVTYLLFWSELWRHRLSFQWIEGCEADQGVGGVYISDQTSPGTKQDLAMYPADYSLDSVDCEIPIWKGIYITKNFPKFLLLHIDETLADTNPPSMDAERIILITTDWINVIISNYTIVRVGASKYFRYGSTWVFHAASSGLVASPNPIAAIPFARASGKDYFRTTIFFPANFVTLLAVIWLDGEHYFSAGMYTPNNIKL